MNTYEVSFFNLPSNKPSRRKVTAKSARDALKQFPPSAYAVTQVCRVVATRQHTSKLVFAE